MSVLRLLACVMVLVLSGCAGRGAAPLRAQDSADRMPCAKRFEPGEAVHLSADPLQPTRTRIDAAQGCEGVALFRLPRFRENWTLDVASAYDGERLYAPRAQLLNEDGRVLRELSFDRFALRGDVLQATVFFDAENEAERYLRLLPAREVLGQTGRRVVSGSFAIPLINTVLPVVYVQGTESERTFRYADSGVVHLRALDASRPRRDPQLHDVARGTLAAFAR